ncbi:hypothetical protein TGP89_240220, partial [Toxoplasma gondii p89]
ILCGVRTLCFSHFPISSQQCQETLETLNVTLDACTAEIKQTQQTLDSLDPELRLLRSAQLEVYRRNGAAQKKLLRQALQLLEKMRLLCPSERDTAYLEALDEEREVYLHLLEVLDKAAKTEAQEQLQQPENAQNKRSHAEGNQGDSECVELSLGEEDAFDKRFFDEFFSDAEASTAEHQDAQTPPLEGNQTTDILSPSEKRDAEETGVSFGTSPRGHRTSKSPRRERRDSAASSPVSLCERRENVLSSGDEVEGEQQIERRRIQEERPCVDTRSPPCAALEVRVSEEESACEVEETSKEGKLSGSDVLSPRLLEHPRRADSEGQTEKQPEEAFPEPREEAGRTSLVAQHSAERNGESREKGRDFAQMKSANNEKQERGSEGVNSLQNVGAEDGEEGDPVVASMQRVKTEEAQQRAQLLRQQELLGLLQEQLLEEEAYATDEDVSFASDLKEQIRNVQAAMDETGKQIDKLREERMQLEQKAAEVYRHHAAGDAGAADSQVSQPSDLREAKTDFDPVSCHRQSSFSFVSTGKKLESPTLKATAEEAHVQRASSCDDHLHGQQASNEASAACTLFAGMQFKKRETRETAGREDRQERRETERTQETTGGDHRRGAELLRVEPERPGNSDRRAQEIEGDSSRGNEDTQTDAAIAKTRGFREAREDSSQLNNERRRSIESDRTLVANEQGAASSNGDASTHHTD